MSTPDPLQSTPKVDSYRNPLANILLPSNFLTFQVPVWYFFEKKFTGNIIQI